MPRPADLGNAAYRKLKKCIQNGEILGNEPLTEASVARRLKLGRAPVRDCLLRLEAEGLLRRGANKARFVIYVEDQDPRRLELCYEVREALDGLAARLAATRMTGAQVIRLRELAAQAIAAVKAKDRHARNSAVGLIRETIRKECGNELIPTALSACGIGLLHVRDDATDAALFAPPYGFDQHMEDMQRVVEAIAAHDPDVAETRMRAWTRAQGKVVIDWVRRRSSDVGEALE